eukprot:128506_1
MSLRLFRTKITHVHHVYCPLFKTASWRFTRNVPNYNSDLENNRMMFTTMAFSGIAYGFYFFGSEQNQNLLNPQWHLLNTLVPVAIYFEQYVQNNDAVSHHIGTNISVICDSCDIDAIGIKKRDKTPSGSDIRVLAFSFDIHGGNENIATVSVHDEYAT